MSLSQQNLEERLLNGEGLYSLRDAAYYARIPQQTLSAWFFGRGEEKYRIASLSELPEKLLTFEEFIEAIAIRHLREKGFSLKAILEALTQAELLCSATRVFTNPDFDFWAEKDNKRLYVAPRDRAPIGLDGRKEIGQMSLQPIIKDYIKLIEFDKNNKASAYRPLERDGFNIALNPVKSFGEPIVEQIGYPTRTLLRALKEEGSVKKAAWMYGVPEGAIEMASAYDKYLRDAAGKIAA